MAGTDKLNPPSADFNKLTLSIELVSPRKLVRVSGYDTGEPHFGKTGSKRFDDPSKDPDQKKLFGTCYLGFKLAVAFAESVLHNSEPSNGGFDVPAADVATRFAVSFKGPKLKLAVVCGNPLLLMGAHGELTGTPDYDLPQQWAAALVGHPANIDGFIYMSRRLNDQQAIVLFQRPGQPGPAIQMDKAIPLADHVDYTAVVRELVVRLT